MKEGSSEKQSYAYQTPLDFILEVYTASIACEQTRLSSNAPEWLHSKSICRYSNVSNLIS